ncbi:hypothetical protein HPB48_013543 [Haemaphysalis longicornis]|uniref:RRM domain-containing protein n=1 Tax=Haemaphysalis longicornis TaxID=44386 RepID=A0A9J6H3B9_HAELO|nr:hypothetical protein HPB48_013543 [Haemaphysalis longicornis]
MAPITGNLKPTGTQVQPGVKHDNGGSQGKTNLIINYLPQCLTNDEFCSIFASIGPIRSWKIVRQKGTGRSYGFGFIDYQDSGDAARAIESLNGLQVMNKRIKVSYARPGGEAIKGAKLYVRGVPKDYPPQQVERVFARFGQIIQLRIIKDRSDSPTGVAFVLYDFRENAEAAIRALTGTLLPGATQPLLVKYALPYWGKRQTPAGGLGAPRQPVSAPRGATGGGFNHPHYGCDRHKPPGACSHLCTADVTPATADNGGQVLFVYNLGADTNESSLWRSFASYGNVINVTVIRDAATGLPTGYGFVTMATYQHCLSAIQALNGCRYT